MKYLKKLSLLIWWHIISQGRALTSQPASPGTYSENDLRAKVVPVGRIGCLLIKYIANLESRPQEPVEPYFPERFNNYSKIKLKARKFIRLVLHTKYLEAVPSPCRAIEIYFYLAAMQFFRAWWYYNGFFMRSCLSTLKLILKHSKSVTPPHKNCVWKPGRRVARKIKCCSSPPIK